MRSALDVARRGWGVLVGEEGSGESRGGVGCIGGGAVDRRIDGCLGEWSRGWGGEWLGGEEGGGVSGCVAAWVEGRVGGLVKGIERETHYLPEPSSLLGSTGTPLMARFHSR